MFPVQNFMKGAGARDDRSLTGPVRGSVLELRCNAALSA